VMKKTRTSLLFALVGVIVASAAVGEWRRVLADEPGRVVVVTDSCMEQEVGAPVALDLIDAPPGEIELLQARGPRERRRSCVAPAE
jgi:hypothetical protein